MYKLYTEAGVVLWWEYNFLGFLRYLYVAAMAFDPKKKTSYIILLLASFAVVSLILWNTNSFFKKFKEEERLKMEIWATAQSELLQSPEHMELGGIHLKVFQNNTTTPMILVNRDGSIRVNNMEDGRALDSLYIQKQIVRFAKENQPIAITYEGEQLATLYYGNSEVLNKLKYYPLALLLIIFLFGTVIFFFFRTNKISEQNKLWAGMAKETAHQIGTPLTSLVGWNELLKGYDINPEINMEIEKDIQRLETIVARFSNIGSMPRLETLDIVAETRNAYDYLKSRSSKLVHFSFDTQNESIPVALNGSLYHWVIENLVKNGIDAMKGKGDIHISVAQKGDRVLIQVTDSGSGIPKGNFNTIFNPGFTSKKRGWGLGLSLAKRIVEEYHQGKIRVMQSTKEGTTMLIDLKIAI